MFQPNEKLGLLVNLAFISNFSIVKIFKKKNILKNALISQICFDSHTLKHPCGCPAKASKKEKVRRNMQGIL